MAWTLERLKEGLERFYEVHGKYPTSQEVDTFEHLPSSRQIQRRFGGLVNLKKQLGLKGPSDYTKGAHSSDRARRINERAHRIEKEVYNYLIDIFGVEFIHREYFFTDDKRARTDFFVYAMDGNFSVDVFYAENRHSFLGCLNSKMRTYGNKLMLQYPVIFLQMNPDITQEEVRDILRQKKNKLLKYQNVMIFKQFKEYCTGKAPLNIKG